MPTWLLGFIPTLLVVTCFFLICLFLYACMWVTSALDDRDPYLKYQQPEKHDDA